MTIGPSIRALLRRFLLWLLRALEDEAATSPQTMTAAGPPADWLARVRRGAPHLLDDAGPIDRAATPIHRIAKPQPQRVPQFLAPVAHVATPAQPAQQRRVRTIVEEELVARRSRDTYLRDGRSVPRLRPIVEPVRVEQRPAPAAAAIQDDRERADFAPYEKARKRAPYMEPAHAPRGRRAIFGVAAPAERGEEPGPLPREERRRPAPADAALSRSAAQFHDAGEQQRGTLSHQPARDAAAPLPEQTTSDDVRRWPGLPSIANDAGERQRWTLPHQPARDGAPLPEQTTGDDVRRWPELPSMVNDAEEPPPQTLDAHWPDLPPLPPFAHELGAIDSLDDSDRLRRIADEQRGSAWSG